MLSLTIVVLAAIAAGFIVWANDKRHAKYGAGLPAGVAVGVAAVSWIILMVAGFGYRPGLPSPTTPARVRGAESGRPLSPAYRR